MFVLIVYIYMCVCMCVCVCVSSLFLFQLSNNFLVCRLEENISLTFVVRDMSFPYISIIFCTLHTYTILINVWMAISPLLSLLFNFSSNFLDHNIQRKTLSFTLYIVSDMWFSYACMHYTTFWASYTINLSIGIKSLIMFSLSSLQTYPG